MCTVNACRWAIGQPIHTIHGGKYAAVCCGLGSKTGNLCMAPVSKGLGGRKQRTNNIVASMHRLLKETLSAVVRMLYSSYASFG